MKKYIYMFCISLLLIVACNATVKDENLPAIKFKFEDNNLSYNDIFKKTDIIPLETNDNCLISTISKMQIFDNKFVILDTKINTLYVFNINGKYLNKIGTIGRGPGEYIRPRDFFINNKDSSIKVFDAAQRKLICYDIYGAFIKEIFFDSYVHRIGENDSGYWGYCSNSQGNSENLKERNTLKFYSFSFNGKINNYILGDKVIDKLNLFAIYHLSDQDKIVSFVEPYSPYIYCFNGSSVSKKYFIDFSGKFPSESVLEQCESLDYPLSPREIDLRDKITENYPCYYVYYFESRKWILISTSFKMRMLLHNKYTNKELETTMLLHSKDSWETFFTPIFLADNCIYSSADYSTLRSFQKNGNSAKRAYELNNLLLSIKENDNPIIFKHIINE